MSASDVHEFDGLGRFVFISSGGQIVGTRGPWYSAKRRAGSL